MVANFDSLASNLSKFLLCHAVKCSKHSSRKLASALDERLFPSPTEETLVRLLVIRGRYRVCIWERTTPDPHTERHRQGTTVVATADAHIRLDDVTLLWHYVPFCTGVVILKPKRYPAMALCPVLHRRSDTKRYPAMALCPFLHRRSDT